MHIHTHPVHSLPPFSPPCPRPLPDFLLCPRQAAGGRSHPPTRRPPQGCPGLRVGPPSSAGPTLPCQRSHHLPGPATGRDGRLQAPWHPPPPHAQAGRGHPPRWATVSIPASESPVRPCTGGATWRLFRPRMPRVPSICLALAWSSPPGLGRRPRCPGARAGPALHAPAGARLCVAGWRLSQPCVPAPPAPQQVALS